MPPPVCMTYNDLFTTGTTYPEPRRWQRDLATADSCHNRLIHIPTGLGKTEGVAAAWLWNRVAKGQPSWPRRLVWCLPMRVLVEQTAARLEAVIGRLAAAYGEPWAAVKVHRLMGGVDTEDWHLEPEREAVLVGTQDMLLSRALNRGYACGRARWPIDYGLLNQDCLWVMDEVQLMDVGLVTSVQLQSYRESAATVLRLCRTWWMSATLQPSWLNTPESSAWLPSLERDMVTVPPAERTDPLWQIPKALRVEPLPFKEDRKHTGFARMVWQEHQQQASPSVTLVVVNRVETASQISRELERLRDAAKRVTDIRIVHSRFRGRERARWPDTFLSRPLTEQPEVDRIIVATQVIEAGVDISCTLMFTELAPWASLVQRFGRVARYGGQGAIVVVDREVTGKDALPYADSELTAAHGALRSLPDVGLASLTDFEEALTDDARSALYPYTPLHVLTPREHDELFDTTPDLTGADLDISRFIRTGEERDITVAWARVGRDETPPADMEPTRDDLCPVAVWRARDWLFDGNAPKNGCRAWVWDYLDDEWRRLENRDLYPGQVVIVMADWGGYDVQRGFTGEPAKTTGPVPYPLLNAPLDAEERSERGDSRDDLSEANQWQTIATHGREVGREAAHVMSDVGLAPRFVALADLAGRLHDWGKAHPAFQASIRRNGVLVGFAELAKAPAAVWLRGVQLYPEQENDTIHRRGFRHELASVLAILELLASVAPMHDGLLGPYAGTGLVDDAFRNSDLPASTLTRELAALSADDLDLLVYLISAHHGKVRAALHVTPHDQDYPIERREPGRGLPLRGIRQGDTLPATRLCDRSGAVVEAPAVGLHLDIAAIGLSRRYGPSWTERVIDLKARFGPGALAFLEALFRAADVRATRTPTADPLIPEPALS